MPINYDLLSVKDVIGYGSYSEASAVYQNAEKKQRRKEQERRRELKPSEFFHTIVKAAKRSNELLIQKGLPYRFCVYMENDEVYIELVVLDSENKITKKERRDITNESFNKWIEDIARSEGLFFDHTI